jgi:hypothetical protein
LRLVADERRHHDALQAELLHLVLDLPGGADDRQVEGAQQHAREQQRQQGF